VALLPASVRRLQRSGVAYRPLLVEPLSVEMGIVWMRASDNPVVAGFVAVARNADQAQFDAEV
jgi:hypothetical protein